MINAHEHHKIIRSQEGTPMTSQTRAARRKLLTDRWTERLTTAGDPHAADRARQFLTDMDDLGFDLPTTLEDAPPLRPTHAATDAAREAALADIRGTLANRPTR